MLTIPVTKLKAALTIAGISGVSTGDEVTLADQQLWRDYEYFANAETVAALLAAVDGQLTGTPSQVPTSGVDAGGAGEVVTPPVVAPEAPSAPVVADVVPPTTAAAEAAGDAENTENANSTEKTGADAAANTPEGGAE